MYKIWSLLHYFTPLLGFISKLPGTSTVIAILIGPQIFLYVVDILHSYMIRYTAFILYRSRGLCRMCLLLYTRGIFSNTAKNGLLSASVLSTERRWPPHDSQQFPKHICSRRTASCKEYVFHQQPNRKAQAIFDKWRSKGHKAKQWMHRGLCSSSTTFAWQVSEHTGWTHAPAEERIGTICKNAFRSDGYSEGA